MGLEILANSKFDYWLDRRNFLQYKESKLSNTFQVFWNFSNKINKSHFRLPKFCKFSLQILIKFFKKISAPKTLLPREWIFYNICSWITMTFTYLSVYGKFNFPHPNQLPNLRKIINSIRSSKKYASNTKFYTKVFQPEKMQKNFQPENSK